MEYNELVEAFAKSLGIEGLEIVDGAAALEIDGMIVMLSHDDAGGTRSSTSAMNDALVISGKIGAKLADGSEAFAELALKANAGLEAHGEGAIALGGDAYTLIQRIPLATLDVAALGEVLGGFVDRLELWSRMLAEFRPAAATQQEGISPSAIGNGFMQV